VARSIIAPAERVTNLRWGMAAVLAIFAGVTLEAGTASLGVAFAGGPLWNVTLLWVAVAVQIAIGWVVDRVGAGTVSRVTILAVTIIGPVGALTRGTWLYATLALMLTVVPVVTMKAIGYWFPTSERGRATAIVMVGALALAVSYSPSALLMVTRNPLIFAISGLLVPIVGCIVFFIFYRDPQNDRRLTHAEGQYLASGNAQRAGRGSARFGTLLGRRAVWGAVVAFSAYVLFFLGLISESTLFGDHGPSVMIALIAAAAGALLSGFVVDAVSPEGFSTTHKIAIIGGLLLAGRAGYYALLRSADVGIAWWYLAMFGLGSIAPIAASLPTFSSPTGRVGIVTGLMSCGPLLILAVVYTLSVPTRHADALLLPLSLIIAFVLAVVGYWFIIGDVAPMPET
jgi:ACS family D-galactonate transporter-like MFS transporter